MNLVFLSSPSQSALYDSIDQFLANITFLFPYPMDTVSMIQLALLLIGGALGLGLLFRLFFGKQCQPNQAVSVVIGILFLYCVTVAIYTINPWQLSQYLSPLPFAIFRKDILIILPFGGTDRMLISSHILSLVILCFIVHFLNMILPKGKSFIIWLFLKILSLALAIFLNLAVNLMITTLLPDLLTTYAPMVLLAVLTAALIIGLFNPLLCILFTVVNPLVGLLYTFFFSSMIGKQLTKAVLSTAILCTFFLVMEHLGYTVFDITSSALLGYLPFSVILLLMYYVFDRKL